MLVVNHAYELFRDLKARGPAHDPLLSKLRLQRAVAEIVAEGEADPWQTLTDLRRSTLDTLRDFNRFVGGGDDSANVLAPFDHAFDELETWLGLAAARAQGHALAHEARTPRG